MPELTPAAVRMEALVDDPLRDHLYARELTAQRIEGGSVGGGVTTVEQARPTQEEGPVQTEATVAVDSAR